MRRRQSSFPQIYWLLTKPAVGAGTRRNKHCFLDMYTWNSLSDRFQIWGHQNQIKHFWVKGTSSDVTDELRRSTANGADSILGKSHPLQAQGGKYLTFSLIPWKHL